MGGFLKPDPFADNFWFLMKTSSTLICIWAMHCLSGLQYNFWAQLEHIFSHVQRIKRGPNLPVYLNISRFWHPQGFQKWNSHGYRGPSIPFCTYIFVYLIIQKSSGVKLRNINSVITNFKQQMAPGIFFFLQSTHSNEVNLNNIKVIEIGLGLRAPNEPHTKIIRRLITHFLIFSNCPVKIPFAFN